MLQAGLFFSSTFCHDMIYPICHRGRQHPDHKSHNNIREPKNSTENKPNSSNHTYILDRPYYPPLSPDFILNLLNSIPNSVSTDINNPLSITKKLERMQLPFLFLDWKIIWIRLYKIVSIIVFSRRRIRFLVGFFWNYYVKIHMPKK